MFVRLNNTLLRYLLVGSLAAVGGAVVLWLFVNVVGLSGLLSAVPASLIVAGPTYIAHRYYTFASENTRTYEFAGFLSVVALNYPMGIGCAWLTIDVLGINAFIAGLIAAGVPPVVNFGLHSKLVFARR